MKNYLNRKFRKEVWMKNIFKTALVVGIVSGLFNVTLSAKGWVMVDPSDGAQLVCCKKKRVVHKRVVKKSLTPCDAIPTAETLPLEPGERLAPADIKRCISCDQKYGVIK